MSIEWSFPFICIMCLGIANMSLGVSSRAWYGCQLKDTHLRTSVTDQARWQWAIHAETIEIKLNMTFHETSVYILELPLMKPGSSNFLLQMRTKGDDYYGRVGPFLFLIEIKKVREEVTEIQATYL